MTKERVDTLKEYFVRKIKRNLSYSDFYALNGVSFSVKRGESIALVGLNGAGKSTLLKVIAGVLKPTKGDVLINGSIAPLIELGAGFDMDLSARENIFLNGTILGHKTADIQKKFDSIVEFSELENFIDVPIKNFSSGMTARLGFSIATAFNPDILIVDEALSVGDYKFQEKCQKRIKEIIEQGSTLLLVSHSETVVRKMCNRTLWLKKGEIVMDGDTDSILKEYYNK
jgi:ABC-type polysaccharide/polyol phosphate transport system ATPase subunit